MKNKTFKKTQSITSTKFNTKICNDKMSFQECEMAILRQYVDKANEAKGKRTVNNEDVKKILTIVEDFIKDNKLICYGGTAINNILPKDAQFYNKEVENIAKGLGFKILLQTGNKINKINKNEESIVSWKRINQYHQTLNGALAHIYGKTKILNKVLNYFK